MDGSAAKHGHFFYAKIVLVSCETYTKKWYFFDCIRLDLCSADRKHWYFLDFVLFLVGYQFVGKILKFVYKLCWFQIKFVVLRCFRIRGNLRKTPERKSRRRADVR